MDDVLPYTPYSDAEQQALVASFAGMGQITDASYASDPLNGDLVCLKLGWGAPQRDQDATNSQPSVTHSVNEWCTAMDGKPVTQSNTTLFQYYPTGNDQFWLSDEYWFQFTDPSCGGDSRAISKDECQSMLLTAMQDCDPNSGTTHGASLVGECIKYVSPCMFSGLMRIHLTLHRTSPSHLTIRTIGPLGTRCQLLPLQSATQPGTAKCKRTSSQVSIPPSATRSAAATRQNRSIRPFPVATTRPRRKDC